MSNTLSAVGRSLVLVGALVALASFAVWYHAKSERLGEIDVYLAMAGDWEGQKAKRPAMEARLRDLDSKMGTAMTFAAVGGVGLVFGLSLMSQGRRMPTQSR